jgi:uncharacterized membrane protein YfcA
MPLGIVAVLLLLSSGAVVGLTLGLIGGGGSVLAVPLLVYLVGVPSAHVAIGSSAVAVALNAAWGLVSHARLGTVKWPCAIVFTAAGVSGAFAGASLGKQLDGTELLALFGLIMIAIGVYMLTFKPKLTARDVKLTRENAAHLLPRLLAIGAGVGLLSGFFGIGGGFLIVPGLVLATGMALQNAIGTSLFAVTTFGLATATSYTSSGLGRLAARGTGYRRGHCRHPHWHPRQCPARRSQTSSCRHFRERGDRRGALRRCERGHETPHLRLGLPRPPKYRQAVGFSPIADCAVKPKLQALGVAGAPGRHVVEPAKR